MADPYWRYGGDGRQQAAAAAALQMPSAKRPRSDYDMPGGHDLAAFYAHEDERAAHRVIRDNDPIGASYDRYLRNSMSYGGGEAARSMGGAIGGRGAMDRSMDDPRMVGIGASDPLMSSKSRVDGGRSEVPLPPDASSTLYVEGLPANCTRREVAHIFRPFVGYKEVRLVTKDARHVGADPLVLCFVDFVSPAHAATAMDALQGYKFDEHDRESVRLRLQFARFPGARSGGGHRGKR